MYKTDAQHLYHILAYMSDNKQQGFALLVSQSRL